MPQPVVLTMDSSFEGQSSTVCVQTTSVHVNRTFIASW